MFTSERSSASLALIETLAWCLLSSKCQRRQKLITGCESDHGEILDCGYCSKGKSAMADTE